MKYIIILCVFLSACGQVYVDPEFQPYVDEFIEDAEYYNSNIEMLPHISISFVDEFENPFVLAQCNYTIYESNVQVKRQSWDSANEFQRKLLVYHELGHCVLGKKHLSDDDIGIMSEDVTFYQNRFTGHQEEWIARLFE